ncbi:MAG: HNH endonuclease signature motif containing protein [Planctomycetota bacterium]
MLPDRIAAKIDAEGDCWRWTGASREGYGVVKVDGETRQAHRVVWQLLVGPIREGLQMDHLCRNRRCVNPDHLEVVTQRQNLLRGAGAPGKNSRKTCCPHGHVYDVDNTYTTGRRRYCRACRRERQCLRRAARGKR